MIPSFPQIKLWADAAAKLTIDTTSLRKIRPNIEKFAVPLGASFCSSALPIKVVYLLNTHNQETLHTEQLTGINKFKPLLFQAYRPSYVQALPSEMEHKKQCGQLANRIAMVRITRPNAGHTLTQLAEYIEADFAQRGLRRD